MISPSIRTASLWDMICLLSGGTFTSVANVSQISDMLYRAVDEEPGPIIGMKGHIFENLQKCLDEILRIAKEADLDATIEMAITCLEIIQRRSHVPEGVMFAKPDIERLGWSLNNLNRTLSAQLHSRVVLLIDSRNSGYVTSTEPPFGNAVDDAFPNAAEELSEAAKCLAFQRNTACVFHLMRAMERAVARLSDVLETGKPSDKEWGKILADIGAAIQAMPKGAKRDQWSECHAHLYHVKQSWRNATMHPKKTYTDDEAQAVFDAVKSFMTNLVPLVT